jgi:hypothetical protein
MALVDLKSKISSKEMKILTSSILILMNACGVDTNAISVEKKREISDLLTIFRVGTQKMKLFKGNVAPDELIPLRLLDIKSNNKKIKSMMNPNNQQSTLASLSSSASSASVTASVAELSAPLLKQAAPSALPLSSPSSASPSTASSPPSLSISLSIPAPPTSPAAPPLPLPPTSPAVLPAKPMYRHILHCIETIEDEFDRYHPIESFIGHQLLHLRAKEIGIDVVEEQKAKSEMQKTWRSLLKETKQLRQQHDRKKDVTSDTNDIITNIIEEPDQSKNASRINEYVSTSIPSNNHCQLPLQSLNTLCHNQILLNKQENDRYHTYSCCCALYGCNNTNIQPNIKMTRVPQPQIKPKPDHIKFNKQLIECYYKKKFHHIKFLKSIGRKNRDWTKEMRICNNHETIKVSYSKKYKHKNHEIKLDFVFDAPVNDGMSLKKDKKAEWKDTAYGHSIIQQWDKRKRDLTLLPGHGEGAAEKIVELAKLVQNMSEEDSSSSLNYSISTYFGVAQSPDVRLFKQTRKSKSEVLHIKKKKKEDVFSDSMNKLKAEVVPMGISDAMIKNRTGFSTQTDLLAYIVIVCNGDLKKIRKTIQDNLHGMRSIFS